jgi:prevent-host-death family protein
MSVRVTVDQLREQLPELLDRAVESGEETIIQRDGTDYAVIVSAREWARRGAGGAAEIAVPLNDDEEEARSERIGKRLDALGPEYRLSPERQTRMEDLFDKRNAQSLAPEEQAELDQILRECDEIMLRRAEALHQVT